MGGVTAFEIGAAMLHQTPAVPADDPVLLQELIGADIAGDIAEIPGHSWVIHGVIPIDRDVIVAEFDTYEQARGVLDQLLGRCSAGSGDG